MLTQGACALGNHYLGCKPSSSRLGHPAMTDSDPDRSSAPDPSQGGRHDEIGDAGALRAFLADRSEEEAFLELARGDRLRLLERSRSWMTKNCYLLQLERLAYATLIQVVASGPTILDSDDLDTWLETTVEIAGRGLLDEDVRLAEQGTPVEEPYEARFVLCMEALMLHPGNVRQALVAANGLSAGERHVFFHCFVHGIGFARYGEREGIDPEHARKLFLRAIDRISDAVGDTE